MNAHVRLLFTCLLSGLPCLAQADCSRAINVPAAPQGVSVVIKEGQVTGVAPDLLRTLSKQTGCEFKLPVVPRARLEMMFRAGDADMLIFSTRSPARDQYGQFVPLFKYRAALVSLKPLDHPVRSIEALAQRPNLRVCLVRGFDYGPAYRNLLAARKGAVLSYAPDVADVMRRLQANIADVTIMTPASAFGALLSDKRLAGLADQLLFNTLDDLPWQDAGVYVSTKALPVQDQATLVNALEHGGAGAQLMKAYADVLPPAILHMTLRRRAAK